MQIKGKREDEAHRQGNNNFDKNVANLCVDEDAKNAAQKGICFPLTLQTLETCLCNWEKGDNKDLGDTYKDVYKECRQNINFQKMLAEKFEEFYKNYITSSGNQKQLVESTISGGYPHVQSVLERIGDRVETKKAIADINSEFENNPKRMALLNLNIRIPSGMTGHTVALSRDGSSLVYLDCASWVNWYEILPEGGKGNHELAGFLEKRFKKISGGTTESVTYAIMKV